MHTVKLTIIGYHRYWVCRKLFIECCIVPSHCSAPRFLCLCFVHLSQPRVNFKFHFLFFHLPLSFSLCLNLDAMISNDDDDDGTVAVPTIDVISNDTFAYSRHDFPNGHAAGRGIVNLNFQYVQLPLLVSGTLHPSKPFETPIMGGSLFAINADFWWRIGAYDDGLNTYGKNFCQLTLSLSISFYIQIYINR